MCGRNTVISYQKLPTFKMFWFEF